MVFFIINWRNAVSGCDFKFCKLSKWRSYGCTHNKETNEIYYKENWIAARYGRKAYSEIKDSDSIKVEVIPFIFGMEYFRNFSAIK